MKTKLFLWWILVLEALAVALFGLFVRFEDSANAETIGDSEATLAGSNQMSLYPVFQDVNVMIFIGFGFLMAFLKFHSWSSIGFNFLIAAFCIQFYILFFGFWHCLIKNEWDTPIEVNISKMITADYCAGAVLITFGAVLGKVSPSQLLVIGLLETCIYSLNEVIVFEEIKAVDVGGSIVIHAFGAFFGLFVAWVASPSATPQSPNNESNYNSNIFAAVGTLFLWMYWPSFNSAIVVTPQEQQMAVFNTMISLTGSALTSFGVSAAYNDSKFKMEDILNASLAGGVIVGSSCNFIVYPAVALLFGVFAGLVSTFGFEVFNECLASKVKLYDTCGVHYLHGLPGILGALLSTVVIGACGSSDYDLDENKYGLEGSFGDQAVNQLLALLITLGFAVFSGVLTGWIISRWNTPSELFVDKVYWTELETDQEFELVNQVSTPRENTPAQC